MTFLNLPNIFFSIAPRWRISKYLIPGRGRECANNEWKNGLTAFKSKLSLIAVLRFWFVSMHLLITECPDLTRTLKLLNDFNLKYSENSLMYFENAHDENGRGRGFTQKWLNSRGFNLVPRPAIVWERIAGTGYESGRVSRSERCKPNKVTGDND